MGVMIQIGGTSTRSFLFPAPLQEALAYYGDVAGSFQYLPHISVVHSQLNHYRLLYDAIESGLYHVRIYCDVMAHVDKKKQVINILPCEDGSPVKRKAGLYSMTCQGFYASEIAFRTAGEQTNIEYSLNMRAELPVPVTLRLVPNVLLNHNAQNKLHLHTDEIINGFIKNSVKAYSLISQA